LLQQQRSLFNLTPRVYNNMSKTVNEENVVITTNVKFKDKSVDSTVKLKPQDIINMYNTKGAQAANQALQGVLKVLYDKTNDNIKQILGDNL
jgi:hypothetical protein